MSAAEEDVPTQRARQREDLSMKIRNLLFKPALHDEARALLDRYHCPVPFHVVRTRFLGQSLLHRLASDPTKLTMGDVAEIYDQVPEMTKTGEHMIYEFVRAAARSRRQLLNIVPTTKPTVH